MRTRSSGATLTAYSSSGRRLWTYNAASGGGGSGQPTITAPIATGSQSSPSIGPNGTVYVTTQALGGGPNQLFAFEGPG
jgi:hypothetical protein